MYASFATINMRPENKETVKFKGKGRTKVK